MRKLEQMAAFLEDGQVEEARKAAHEFKQGRRLPVSESNEDDISMEFAAANDIVVDCNKAGGEGQAPILLITKYARSRPDFMRTVQHRIQDAAAENDENDDSSNKVVSIATEHTILARCWL